MSDREERKARRREKRAANEALESQRTAIHAVANQPEAGAAVEGRLDPAEMLGDIDAWNLRSEGGWLRFDARLEAEPRGYLRPATGGDILADAPGPLLAILGLGGARRAGFNAGPAQFRYNVLAPADHIGAVGLEGTDTAIRTGALQHLRHRSREALIADHLLRLRHQARRGMPLFLTRVETDDASSVHALGKGTAFANFLIALDNLVDAAARLGRRPRVLAVTLGYGLEDLTSDSNTFARDFRALMDSITTQMRDRGLLPPAFLADAESGMAGRVDHPAVAALHGLAWGSGRHRLILAAPASRGQQDRFGRLTEAGRLDMAELDAYALNAIDAGEEWFCPLPVLAEYAERQIRVTFRAQSDLVIDPGDPHPAGAAAGLRLTGGQGEGTILGVRIARDDPKALILDCSGPPQGHRLRLGCVSDPVGEGAQAGCGAIRDSWTASGASGHPLYRWALPADLPLNRATPHCIREANE